MIKVKGYSYKRKGKIIHVKAYTRKGDIDTWKKWYPEKERLFVDEDTGERMLIPRPTKKEFLSRKRAEVSAKRNATLALKKEYFAWKDKGGLLKEFSSRNTKPSWYKTATARDIPFKKFRQWDNEYARKKIKK